MITVSVLIPTIPQHETKYKALLRELIKQAQFLPKKYKILLSADPRTSLPTGYKRNHLLEVAKGDYLHFVDADDMIVPDFYKTVFPLLEEGPDCLSLRGIMTTDGKNPELFEHSLRYKEWRTTNNEIKYERYPNHLNVIKSSIAKKIEFPEITFGEDHKWSTALNQSGMLKNEIYVDKVLYYYQYVTKKDY